MALMVGSPPDPGWLLDRRRRLAERREALQRRELVSPAFADDVRMVVSAWTRDELGNWSRTVRGE